MTMRYMPQMWPPKVTTGPSEWGRIWRYRSVQKMLPHLKPQLWWSSRLHSSPRNQLCRVKSCAGGDKKLSAKFIGSWRMKRDKVYWDYLFRVSKVCRQNLLAGGCWDVLKCFFIPCCKYKSYVPSNNSVSTWKKKIMSKLTIHLITLSLSAVNLRTDRSCIMGWYYIPYNSFPTKNLLLDFLSRTYFLRIYVQVARIKTKTYIG